MTAFCLAPTTVRFPTLFLGSPPSSSFTEHWRCVAPHELRNSSFVQPRSRCRSHQGGEARREASRAPRMDVATHVVPTLYHVPWFCSSIPYQLLLELDIPRSEVDVITLSQAELRTSPEIEFLSPRRVVPFVAFPDGTTMVEAGAIVLYLCETFDKEHRLHPGPGEAGRLRYLQGVVYGVAEGYRAVRDVFEECFGKSQEERAHSKLGPLMQKFNTVVVEHLMVELEEEGRMFYLGDEFSVVDIVFGYILMTAEFADAGLLENEGIKKYHERVKERAAYKELFSPAAVS